MTNRLIDLSCSVIVVSFLAAGLASTHAQQSCEALKNLKLEGATIVSATSQEPSPLEIKLPPIIPFHVPEVTIPRHCEVRGIARPTSDSEINFVLWLPPSESWNGKYMQLGNGGWAGTLSTDGFVAPLLRGYAAAATDDGHHALPGVEAANFAIGHPEKLIDFGYRAVHQTAKLSKAIVEAYYGKSAGHDYFFGCSDGGREALMEAERFPEDFDGIIAGDPASDWTHLFDGFAWDEVAVNAKPESRFTGEQLSTIQKAALAACDTLDGVKDGVIGDPRKCRFDPQMLLCHGTHSNDCLTQPQIEAVKKIYAGPKDPKTGVQIFPGYMPGTEADPVGWGFWMLGSAQREFANSFFSGAVYENSKWDWRTLDFRRDPLLADEKTASILNADNPDLRSFRDHGGKLIQYHGWGDAAISPLESVEFYEKVEDFLKSYPDPRSSNPADIYGFYRLYMVPGLQHCALGPGAVNFGNFETIDMDKPGDADHDVENALDRWVTQGIAPDAIIASGTIAADPQKGAGGVPITRPLCPYPKIARYKGHGDTNAAENFVCAEER